MYPTNCRYWSGFSSPLASEVPTRDASRENMSEPRNIPNPVSAPCRVTESGVIRACTSNSRVAVSNSPL